MAKGDDIQERLIDFAVSIIQLTTKLPKGSAGKHIAGQLLRSGTSPAPNYAEARSAESPNDFIHKLKIALKELNETTVWLQIITRSQMVPIEECIGLQKECGELCRIISSSVKTSQRRRKK
ncbi:MAG: four helix bundle protein [Proteobacteria bacterium]|nr:four helix bundle protein [Pseudomonadota bacterium]MBU4258485.1 four helix bundle protein [Pseudomonadota bacterium]MBU4287051.1 four helix bundle protein [Pseudomonadota bacterium]MBU4415126.1 four helix bundle protein [Pseudomonadota bacterium]MCG2758844.1 four helix bundle protein [Desulfobacteraceae bacterium]